MVTLFHGTTAARAEAIQRHGWTDVDIDVAIAEACEQYEVDPQHVRARIEERFSYISSTGRSGWVSFALGRDSVEQHWAQKAPEHRHEILEFVWLAMNPDVDWRHGLPDQARAWRFQQVADEPLAVIEVALPLRVLTRGGHSSSSAPPLTEDVLEIYLDTDRSQDIRAACPLSPDCIVDVWPVERLVSINDAGALLGVDLNTVMQRSAAGELGELVDCDRWGPKWRWAEFRRALSA